VVAVFLRYPSIAEPSFGASCNLAELVILLDDDVAECSVKVA
jgi:hypothetical protein